MVAADRAQPLDLVVLMLQTSFVVFNLSRNVLFESVPPFEVPNDRGPRRYSIDAVELIIQPHPYHWFYHQNWQLVSLNIC